MTDTIKLQGLVTQDALRAMGEGLYGDIKLSKRGEPVLCDFYTEMALEGRVYQIKAGTVTAPLVGDQPLADTAAEFCADAPTGTTMIPVYLHIACQVATGTDREYKLQSIAAVSTSGTNFVPLPLYMGGIASQCTGRVQAAGTVTVGNDVVTTTRQHFCCGSAIAQAAGAEESTWIWQPRTPPIDTGPACCYCQIAATTTGPSYFGSLDFIELPTTSIS